MTTPAEERIFLSRTTALACHDLMNVLATLVQNLGLMDDLLALDRKRRILSLGLKSGFEHRERFETSIAAMQQTVKRGVALVEALGFVAHSVDEPGSPHRPAQALAALTLLAERLAKKTKASLAVEPGADRRVPGRAVEWLEPTLAAVEAALEQAGREAEIVLSSRLESDKLVVRVGVKGDAWSRTLDFPHPPINPAPDAVKAGAVRGDSA